jgi:hypothetical protein
MTQNWPNYVFLSAEYDFYIKNLRNKKMKFNDELNYMILES